MNFTALDFETANSTRTSICAIGMVRVENGEVVKSVHKLIKPDSPFNSFNTAIHGIRAFDVRNAPRFPDFWEEMRPFLTDTVVAHNAAFDISCLKASVDFYGLEPPSFEYICTLCISRRINPLPSHKLDALVRHFGLGGFNHHNALDDALACARLFNIFEGKTNVDAMKKTYGAQKIKKKATPQIAQQNLPSAKEEKLATSDFGGHPNFLTSPKIYPANAPSAYKKIDEPQACKIYVRMENDVAPPPEIKWDASFATPQPKQKAPRPSPQRDLVFDYSAIDFSKNFVVTGMFANMARNDAEGLILYRGGNVERNTSANTDYVIVGSRRSPSWKFGEYGSKIDDALAYGRAAFITEEHFLREV